jgi:hypothetical protein
MGKRAPTAVMVVVGAQNYSDIDRKRFRSNIPKGDEVVAHSTVAMFEKHHYLCANEANRRKA